MTVALIAGGMLFLPWLPTVFKGFDGYSSKAFVGMTAVESLVNIVSVYSNEIWLIPIGLLLLIIWRRKQLTKLQGFFLILALLAIAIMLLANEITPILLSNRLRYMLVFAPLLASSLATGWNFLPKRPLIQLLMIGAWMIAFFAYSQSEVSYIATKRKSLETRHAPPYPSLAYHPEIEIGSSEPIVSLHPSRKITWITGDYYQKLISPANLVHLFYDGGGTLVLQTTRKQLDSLDHFVSQYAAFWLLYDPQETDEQSMSGVFQWMRNYYRSCGQYLEDADAVIQRFVRDSDPCES